MNGYIMDAKEGDFMTEQNLKGLKRVTIKRRRKFRKRKCKLGNLYLQVLKKLRQ